MPGPANSKKKSKAQSKKAKQAEARKRAKAPGHQPSNNHDSVSSRTPPPPPPPPQPTPPRPSSSTSLYSDGDPIPSRAIIRAEDFPVPPQNDVAELESRLRFEQYMDSRKRDLSEIPEFLRGPCVKDMGNGPQVRDVTAFLHSKIAAPPSLDVGLCAEFAQKEVLEMLSTLLPEETAMIVWYNSSRAKSRVCPACRRLYHLGSPPADLVSDHNDDENLTERDQYEKAWEVKEHEESRRLHAEQEISGICSALCYLLIASNWPGVIRSVFGRRAEDISDEVWEELDGPGVGQNDKSGLGTMLKMTRCHDLGLAQMLFPDVDWEKEMAGSAGNNASVPPSPSPSPPLESQRPESPDSPSSSQYPATQ